MCGKDMANIIFKLKDTQFATQAVQNNIVNSTWRWKLV